MREIEHFAACIRCHTPPQAGGVETAYRIQGLIETAYRLGGQQPTPRPAAAHRLAAAK
jgi:hypothetical protein